MTLNGLVPDPALIRVRAVPLGIRMLDGRKYTPDPRAVTKMAVFTPTADPHVSAFSIKGLVPGILYQIGVAIPPNPITPEAGGPPGYGKIFWRGPKYGLAVSGDPAGMAIEGFAARTEVEVLQPGTNQWVGADDLQFDNTDPAVRTRTLRWRTSLPNVTGAELQISTEPFPTKGNFSTCDEPETGIVARQSLALRGDPATNQSIAPMDFGPILGGRTSDAIGISDPGVGGIPERTRRLLMMGAPVYVRVIPHTAEGPVCSTKENGVAGWVMMAKGPGSFDLPPEPVPTPAIEPWDGHTYTPPFLGGQSQGHPTYGELGFKVIKDHKLATLKELGAGAGSSDPLGAFLVGAGMANPGSTLLAKDNLWFFFTPQTNSSSGGNFFSNFASALEGVASAFGGLVTATVNFTGSVVDYLHNLTEEIKNAMADTVVDLASYVPGVDELCGAVESAPGGASCEDVVKAGLEYGMTSMGMPPSIPNWDELKEQGADYLAAEVASEIGDPTGFTKEFIKEKAQEIVNNTMARVSASRGGSDPSYDWVIPYLGFEPAVWNISAHKTVAVAGDLPSNLFLRVPETGLYLGANVHVPSKFPDTNLLKIPVVLQPNTAGIPVPECRWGKPGYNPSNPFNILCQPMPGQTKPTCWAYRGQKWTNDEWEEVGCSWNNWVGIYYRDAWIAQRYDPTACTGLGASSFTYLGLGIWLPYTPPFTAVALLPPDVWAEWDGSSYSGCGF